MLLSIDLCTSIDIIIQNLPAISGRLETASILKADILIQEQNLGSITTKTLLVKYMTKGIMNFIIFQM